MSDLSSGVRAVMPDVQGRHDVRAMPIARVGVNQVRSTTPDAAALDLLVHADALDLAEQLDI